ncbi:MAG: SRPBCC domain-containing protein [Balneolales bacterium]|nr:SRPBCC domain-containing protein [Balneolales bacterium]
MENEVQEVHPIIITRVFNAPVELFYKVWTKPEHIAQWWGPQGFSTRVEEYQFEVGGRSKFVMTGPDGTEYPVMGRFLEIVENKRIVTTDEFGDEYKEMAKKMNMEIPRIDKLVAIFEEVEGKTKLTLMMHHPTERDRELHEKMHVAEGWNSSFDCLDEYLETL